MGHARRPTLIQRVVTLLSPLLQCPVHLGTCYFADCPPFKHNIRLRPGEQVERWPKPDHAFIYSITHGGTGVCYVGCTEMRLSERWANHRSARKSEKQKNDPLYSAMNEDGLHMFVMEELEECGKSIKRERELDYMRKLDSWNPKQGYNNPGSEAVYARNLYFLLNPGQELRYETLRANLKSLDDGWREPLPHDQKLREELQEVTDTFLQEGRRLMKSISSLASPVVLASPGQPMAGCPTLDPSMM